MDYEVSIITATYNSIDYLEATHKSILSQKYLNWEWLITDDCSSDGTFDYLKEIAEKDPRIKVFRNTINSGAAVSRNNSLSKATGRYIAFIDSDDIWHADKLQKQVSFMADNKYSFTFTSYLIVNQFGESQGTVVDKSISKVSYKDMLRKKATLGCSTVMIDRKSVPDLKMPLLRTGQDYATWLKVLKTGLEAHCLSEPLTHYRISPNSISRNKVKKAKRQWQIYREVEGCGLMHSTYYFFNYAWRAIFRS